MKKLRLLIITVGVSVFIISGCATKYKIVDHQSYTEKGSVVLEVQLTDNWKADEIKIYPKTEYGILVLNGKIPSYKVDQNYMKLVKSENSSNGTFTFNDLPEGKYTLICTASKEEWMSAEEIAQSYSFIKIPPPDGKTLTIKTSKGILTRDDNGKWRHSGQNVKRTKNIQKDVSVQSNKNPIEISLP